MNIRPIIIEDINNIDVLINQLGYPSSNQKIKERRMGEKS